MRDDSSTTDSGTAGAVLDGAWLRRERERIAIGRRQVADRLGLPESQVIRVELNQRPVPLDWFVALAELGFPVPVEDVPANAKTESTTAGPANFPAVADVPPPVDPASAAEVADSAPISPVLATSGPCGMEDAPSSPQIPEAAPEPPAGQSVAALDGAALPSTPSAEPSPSLSGLPSVEVVPSESSERAQPPTTLSVEPSPSLNTAPSDASGMAGSPVVAASSALPHRRALAVVPSSTPLRGRWLRAQRQACDVSLKRLCHAFGIPKSSLPHLERNDIPIPSAWLPKLAELGLLPDGSHDILSTSPTAAVRYTGRWLRRERKKRGMLHIAIAPALHVACASLEVIEARDWPLPPEWLPILRRLGLMESAVAAARLAQATPSPETASSDATPKVPRQRSARATRSSNRMLAAKSQGTLEGKSLTGVWLRQVRLKRSITQRWLSEQLNVNQTKLWRCESENQPLPPGWLPILSRLGWLAPSTSKAAPSTAVSPAALTKPARKKTVRAAAGPVIDGRWLKAERHRLKLSRRTIEDELHTSHQQYRRFEGGHALLPRSWWQGLRKLRFHLPDSFPQPATPATPLVGPPNGAWLALERKRLALTEYEVVHALRINALQLRRVERESDELPKAWLAKLPLLGIAVETTTARRGQARKATLAATAPASPARPSKPRKQAATAAPTNDSGPATVPPPTPAAGEGADLAALIVHYRVSFGRRAKQPAFEILRRILTDLSESGLDGTITDEDVERAAQVLIRRR